MSMVDISPVRQLARHAQTHADMTAVVYEGRSITYRDLHARAESLAGALEAGGVGAGDRVAYAGHNSLTLLETFFAAVWVGAAFLPMNFRLAAAEIEGVLQDARPAAVIAEPKHAALIDVLHDSLRIGVMVQVDDDPLAGDAASLVGPWSSLRAFRGSGARRVHVPRREEDLAAVLYTSGTTGRPKGVMLTHGNLWWNWANVDSVVDTRFGDVCLAAAPLFHIGGLNALTLRTLTRGGTVVVRRAFDPAQALKDLVEGRVNSMFLVPAMLAAIERQPEFAGVDLGDLRSAIAAGAPVPPSLIEAFARKGVLIQQAWGLTETSPFATYLEARRTTDKLGSCGVPMPYSEVEVFDPTTLERVSSPGVTGEIWVRGPNVSTGYWNNPDATAAVFTDTGWFRTGDLGLMDDDGYFFIVDRLKDMVISGGENVYPAEVENALSAHEDIADVAVIGIPDEKWGEAVCAVVAFRGEALSLEEIREFLGGRIARYKLPSRLVAVDTVPRNGAGKLDKPLIRRMHGAISVTQTVDAAPFTEALKTPASMGT